MLSRSGSDLVFFESVTHILLVVGTKPSDPDSDGIYANINIKYERVTYQTFLCPLSDPVYADVVFVHGLLGGPFKTWRQRDPDPPGKNHLTKDKTPTPAGPGDGGQEKGEEETTDCWPKVGGVAALMP